MLIGCLMRRIGLLDGMGSRPYSLGWSGSRRLEFVCRGLAGLVLSLRLRRSWVATPRLAPDSCCAVKEHRSCTSPAHVIMSPTGVPAGVCHTRLDSPAHAQPRLAVPRFEAADPRGGVRGRRHWSIIGHACVCPCVYERECGGRKGASLHLRELPMARRPLSRYERARIGAPAHAPGRQPWAPPKLPGGWWAI